MFLTSVVQIILKGDGGYRNFIESILCTRLLFLFSQERSEGRFGHSFRTWLQIILSSSHWEEGSILWPLPLNLSRLVTSLTVEYGGSDAMWLPRPGNKRLWSFCFVGQDTHSWNLESSCKKSQTPEATMLWGSPSYMERPWIDVLVNSLNWEKFQVILAEVPNNNEEETTSPHCALSKLLTLRICDHDKLLFFKV